MDDPEGGFGAFSGEPFAPSTDQSPHTQKRDAQTVAGLPLREAELPGPLACWRKVDVAALPKDEQVLRAAAMAKLDTLPEDYDDVRAVADWLGTALLAAKVGL